MSGNVDVFIHLHLTVRPSQLSFRCHFGYHILMSHLLAFLKLCGNSQGVTKKKVESKYFWGNVEDWQPIARVYWLKKDLEALDNKNLIGCGRGKKPLNMFVVDGEIPGKLSISAQKSLNYTWTWKSWTDIYVVLSFLCFFTASTFIWASFLVWNERRVPCCSCRICPLQKDSQDSAPHSKTSKFPITEI